MQGRNAGMDLAERRKRPIEVLSKEGPIAAYPVLQRRGQLIDIARSDVR